MVQVLVFYVREYVACFDLRLVSQYQYATVMVLRREKLLLEARGHRAYAARLVWKSWETVEAA
jgi:hypothetical protein